ncbi:MAG: lamin tail domain-containing protein [Candidatus Wildermuthbacteria bacterium]|nr:lamin tail domain-containing protein [Candidatus Wildermuthbacteria bacterium]
MPRLGKAGLPRRFKAGRVLHGMLTLLLVGILSVGSSGLVLLAAAFESHIVNVTAAISQIDPAVLTSPGDIGFDNPDGGTNLTAPLEVVMTDTDSDATHIFYTYGSGLDPLSVPEPVCGQADPNGGGGEIATEIISLALTGDTVIRAIACDGADSSAHHSFINTKIYDFTDLACVPQSVEFPANLAVLAAGPGNSSNGDIFASANVTINGDVRSNDDINANGGGANRTINGNALAGDTIETANFTISGTVATDTPATTLPDINIPFWQARAAEGGTVSGSIIIPGTAAPSIDFGPTEIEGNLEIGTNNVINVKGPIYVKQNLVISSNVTLNQDPAFGDQFTAIIVDGTIDISSNVAFNGTGSIGTFLLVSTSGPKVGDNAAIEANSNNSDLGDVVLFASAGDVHMNSNRNLLAIFATIGTSASNPAIDLDSNVTVNYRELPGTISCGPVFTPLDQVLINEFLPNPTGADNAAMPDGEFVELYNGSGSPVDVNGWVLYDNFVPVGSATNKTWTSSADFNAGGTASGTTVSANSVQMSAGEALGTFENFLDAGEGNKGDWQNLTWGETLGATSDICVEVATSNDGAAYSDYSAQDCTIPFSLTGISDSRFIKWRSMHSRSDISHSANLNELTISYNRFNYNELVITPDRTLGGDTVIPAGGLLVVYRDGDIDFELTNDADTVKLYDDHVWLGGTLVDSHAYDYGTAAPNDKSFARIPDGSVNWVDPDPTPGEPNDEFVDPSTVPSEAITFESEPVAEEELIEDEQSVAVQEESTVPAETVEETDTPAAAEEAPEITDESSTPEAMASEPPATTEEQPATTEESPATVEGSPAVTEEPVITEEPAAVPEPSSPPEADSASKESGL